MRNTILVLLLHTCALLSGQSFYPVSGPLLVREVYPNLANECYIYFEDNNTQDSLHLKWRLGDIIFPEGWDISICDYGGCYFDLPNAKTMLPAPDTVQPYLKLVVSPGTTAGSGWVWFRVSRATDENDFQDVYFSMHLTGSVNVSDKGAWGQAEINPNPCSDQLNIRLPGADIPLSVYHLNGRKYWEGIVNEQVIIDTHTWPNGMYLVQSPWGVRKIICQN